MKDIDGVNQVLEVIKPHMDSIEKHFSEMNGIFINLMEQPHDNIGRVLKCHLVVEHFLTKFLVDFYRIDGLENLQLRFAQKIELVPRAGGSASFVRPGIIQLNKIRNKLGHDLSTQIERHNISAIYEVLAIARKGINLDDPIKAIEAFTPIACAFLSVPPPELQKIFMEAFQTIVTHDPE
jgi:hypothetical protein